MYHTRGIVEDGLLPGDKKADPAEGRPDQTVSRAVLAGNPPGCEHLQGESYLIHFTPPTGSCHA